MNDMGWIEKRKKCMLDKLFPKCLLMYSIMWKKKNGWHESMEIKEKNACFRNHFFALFYACYECTEGTEWKKKVHDQFFFLSIYACYEFMERIKEKKKKMQLLDRITREGGWIVY